MHRTTAPTQPSIRQWAISGVLPYIAHQNTDPADQELSGAAQDTKGSPTCFQDTASGFDLIRLHARLPESYGESSPRILIEVFHTQPLQSSGAANG
jgi:hypothetical protein